ncbi:SNF1-interacting protein [Bachmanniomyces sp. S44760]|nr:SNF1-interacting protein [Bachmanniomyces sp. S44760]
MGNSQTKEQRSSNAQLRPGHPNRASAPAIPIQNDVPVEGTSEYAIFASRQGINSRSERSELSNLLGLTSHADREINTLEVRRETKQERDARRLERDRIARERERERSMREEGVDGGFLVTQGVYTGIEDYNQKIVRHLMVSRSFPRYPHVLTPSLKIDRRIAPFWKGLNDHSKSWTENQLIAAAEGLPIPAPDEVPRNVEPASKSSEQNIDGLTVPITSRSQSYNSDTSAQSPSYPNFSFPSATSPSSASNIFRGRAKTLASLTTSSKNVPQAELTPREMQLPKDRYVNGQPIEAFLYKHAAECPICFLYYPPHLNKTRCCDQSICSECFVQIKRPDPHPPEHGNPDAPRETVEAADSEEVSPETLVSEPAACPFCVQPEFGITYDPPPFKRGLTYISNPSSHPSMNPASAMSSSSSLSSYSVVGSQPSPSMAHRRRTTSISATSSNVITTDRIRPDWATKLSTARAHAARRSAAATALHTAAYLMGNRNQSPDSRAFAGFGRRGMLRHGAGGSYSPSRGTSSSQLNMLALMSERYASALGPRAETSTSGEGLPTIDAPPRGSSRRNRMDDLEEMMMMEAIRLSLASEEERRKREEKDSKKEAKKKGKETKKADKAAKKAGDGVYGTGQNISTPTLDSSQSQPSSLYRSSTNESIQGKFSRFDSSPSLGKASSIELDIPSSFLLPNKASSITETSTTPSLPNPQTHLERSRANLQPTDLPYGASSYKPSHLRNLSNASSSGSSLAESPSQSLLQDGASPASIASSPSSNPKPSAGIDIPARGLAAPNTGADVDTSFKSATPPGGGAGIEPMFNFRSLAAMIGDDEKAGMTGESSHEENQNLNAPLQSGHQRGESSSGIASWKSISDRDKAT